MSIKVVVQCNNDDALIAWRPDAWPAAWVGFMVERKNDKTGEITALNNRIPAVIGQGQTPAAGVSSLASPFRRCMWIDHMVDPSEQLQYRVTPMVAADDGGFSAATDAASDWTAPTVAVGEDASKLSAFFNRGILMSQVVSRFVQGDVTASLLAKFKSSLKSATFPPRKYLSGQARQALLGFLGDADRRGSQIYAAVYECDDQEIIDAVKAFGSRGHYLVGNGGNAKDLPDDLSGAGLEVHERDLSHAGRSSPSVHNKFVVEVNTAGQAIRVLTGSLNWTTTGLCTQLNNTLIIERPVIAERFLMQWRSLVAAGDDMPDDLKAANAQWLTDDTVSIAYAATTNQQEFAPVLDAINGAQQAIFFLMFEPGGSPLLEAALQKSAAAGGAFVRGVVSTVVQTKNGTITHQGSRVYLDNVTKDTDDDVILPDGVGEADRPSWAFDEFNRSAFQANNLHAIVHSKAMVIDPFSDDCCVVTGSHNFSPAASKSNDENIVVIKGDRDLAREYAVHIQGVYDAFSWRAFLDNRQDPNVIYQGLDTWKPGGSRARELDFWVDGAGA